MKAAQQSCAHSHAKTKAKPVACVELDVVQLVEDELENGDGAVTLADAIRSIAVAHKLSFSATKAKLYRQKAALQAAAAVAVSADSPRAPTTKERALAMEQFVQSGLSQEVALDTAIAGSATNPSAVQRAYYRHRARPAVHGGANVSPQQDRDLLAAVLALAALNFPPSAADVEEFAIVLGVKFATTYGNKWGRRWLKAKYQQGALSRLRRGKAVSQGRADQTQMLESCQRFADELQKEIDEHGHPPAHAFINADETLLLATGSGVHAQRVTRRGASRVSVAVGAGGNTIGSLLAFVDAAGASLLRVLVLKKKLDKDGLVDLADVVVPVADATGSARGKVTTLIMFSKSGLIDEAMYFEIVKAFCDEWGKRGIGADLTAPAPLWAFVFLDQLAVHRARAVLLYALSKNVHLWSLPRNTSHLTQPLDDVVFAGFKSSLRALFEKKKERRLKHDETIRCRELLLQSVWEAYTLTFKPDTIMKAFSNVHLFPFEKAAFLAHCKDSIGSTMTAEHDTDAARVAERIVHMLTVKKKETETEEKTFVKVGGRPGLRVLQQDVHSPRTLVRIAQQHDEIVADLQKKKSDKKEARVAAAVKRKRDAVEKAEAEKCHHVDKSGGPACTAKYRGGGAWFVCGICSTYKLCGKHNCERKRSQHAHTCDALPRRPSKRSCTAK